MRVLLWVPLQYSSDSTCSRQTLQLAGRSCDSRLGLLRTVAHTDCSFITAQIGRGPGRSQNAGSVLLKQGSKHTRTAIEDHLVKAQTQSMAPLSKRPWNTSCFSLQPRHPRAAAQDTSHPPGFSRIRESRAQDAPPAMLVVVLMSPGTRKAPNSAKATPCMPASHPGNRTSLRWQHFPLQNCFLL